MPSTISRWVAFWVFLICGGACSARVNGEGPGKGIQPWLPACSPLAGCALPSLYLSERIHGADKVPLGCLRCWLVWLSIRAASCTECLTAGTRRGLVLSCRR